jgi:hypothetical protein
MPSVHVAWAVLIAWAVYRIGSGIGRYAGIVHAVVTAFVVVVTANHFWADGIVAVAVLVACALVEDAGNRVVDRVRTTREPVPPPVEAGVSS